MQSRDTTNTFQMQEAIVRDDVNAVAALLANGLDPTSWHSDALRRASDCGAVNVVRLLLADGRSDPGAYYNAAVRHASLYNHTSVLRLLLADPRADPCEWDDCALRWARSAGHVATVRVLLADGRVDKHGAVAQAIKKTAKAAVARALARPFSRWFACAKS